MTAATRKSAPAPPVGFRTGEPPADVVDVPLRAGLDALDRLRRCRQPALAPGPVAVTGERCLFLVAQGGAANLPELLDWLEWSGVDLDLCCRPWAAAGALLDREGLECPQDGLEWLTDRNVRPPELIALLATLADSCYRLGLAPGFPPR